VGAAGVKSILENKVRSQTASFLHIQFSKVAVYSASQEDNDGLRFPGCPGDDAGAQGKGVCTDAPPGIEAINPVGVSKTYEVNGVCSTKD